MLFPCIADHAHLYLAFLNSQFLKLYYDRNISPINDFRTHYDQNMVLINDFRTHYDQNMIPINDVGTHCDQNLVSKSRNYAYYDNFDTHYDHYCDQDDDQDHTINNFGTHYDQNNDQDDDRGHIIKHFNYETDDVYNKTPHDLSKKFLGSILLLIPIILLIIDFDPIYCTT